MELNMSESKVEMSEELAMEEVRRWAEMNDIDLEGGSDEVKAAFESGTKRIVRAIRRGLLELSESGDFVYTVSARSPAGFAGEKIVLAAPTGKAFMAIDSFKQSEIFHRILAFASAMTGKDVGWFGRLSHTDFAIISDIVGFFMAS